MPVLGRYSYGRSPSPDVDSVTISHKCEGKTKKLIVLCGGHWSEDAATVTIDSVTYNGVSLTRTSAVGKAIIGTISCNLCEIWYLDNPPVDEDHDVVVTASIATGALNLHVYCLALDVFNTNSGEGASDVAIQNSPGSLTVDGSITTVYDSSKVLIGLSTIGSEFTPDAGTNELQMVWADANGHPLFWVGWGEASGGLDAFGGDITDISNKIWEFVMLEIEDDPPTARNVPYAAGFR